jgi:hypothetical protein
MLFQTGRTDSTVFRLVFTTCSSVQWSSLTRTLLSSSLMQTKMSCSKHLHGEVPELGKGNEASVFLVDGAGRTSGHEVRDGSICWDCM